MPKDLRPRRADTPPVSKPAKLKQPPKLTGTPSVVTAEVNAFIEGVFTTFREHFDRYMLLMQHEKSIQAQLEIAEKTVCLTREFLVDTIRQSEGTGSPTNWQTVVDEVRFIGVRLVDACLTVLQEKQKLTPEGLLTALNAGNYRFRTASPLREIHAAMLRQRRALKIGNEYVWASGGEPVEIRPRLSAVTNMEDAQLGATGTEE